ncbi:MAG: pyridoxal-dependent decarboxylase [Planctomycetota bacterium]|nr:pyridoxal-dependent decarboxylase [Planctomycetota bacterium]MEC9158106.1 pyridoxal-dependent decarboxylase [Planctomycetota bacterium]
MPETQRESWTGSGATAHHMDEGEFRRFGKEMIDWVADYLYGGVEKHPVQSRAAPGEVRSMLPGRPPREGEGFKDIIADLDRIVLPGLTHWQHPNWHGYFPANTSGPSILGDLVASGLGVQGMLWSTSPACTEVETLVMDWMAQALELPECYQSVPGPGGGVIQDTASSASFVTLLAARERATDWRSNREGLGAIDRRLVAYTSNQAHSSIAKAMKMAGMGEDQLRLVGVDDGHRMDPSALEECIRRDLADGHLPCYVCATLGTTSSVAIDPVREIAEITDAHGIWLHVDGAFAGAAAICPEYRGMHEGLELADSYTFNPHKWLFTNFDCNCLWLRDREPLVRTLTVMPEYLRNEASESGRVIDYRDWQVPLGRRFRALKLWFVMRFYGIEGLQALIRHHVELASHFERLVEGHPSLELSTPRNLTLTCFHHQDGDAATEELLKAVNATGDAYLSHTRLGDGDGGDRFVIRVSIGQSRIEREHVDRAFELIAREADRLSRR